MTNKPATPTTQSVCKHCQQKLELIAGLWKHVNFNASSHGHVAEPASTGEQPPASEWDQEYPRDNRFEPWPLAAFAARHSESTPASHFTGVEPEYIEAMNHGSDMTVEKLLDIVANGQAGKFGGEKLQQLADWIVEHRVAPASTAHKSPNSHLGAVRD